MPISVNEKAGLEIAKNILRIQEARYPVMTHQATNDEDNITKGFELGVSWTI
jgi:hypothetical protein